MFWSCWNLSYSKVNISISMVEYWYTEEWFEFENIRRNGIMKVTKCMKPWTPRTPSPCDIFLSIHVSNHTWYTYICETSHAMPRSRVGGDFIQIYTTSLILQDRQRFISYICNRCVCVCLYSDSSFLLQPCLGNFIRQFHIFRGPHC